MSLFDALGGNRVQENPQQMMQKLQQNPAAVLKQKGYNIPDGMSNPQTILNHLLQTGQLTNSRLQALGQVAMNLFRR